MIRCDIWTEQRLSVDNLIIFSEDSDIYLLTDLLASLITRLHLYIELLLSSSSRNSWSVCQPVLGSYDF